MLWAMSGVPGDALVLQSGGAEALVSHSLETLKKESAPQYPLRFASSPFLAASRTSRSPSKHLLPSCRKRGVKHPPVGRSQAHV